MLFSCHLSSNYSGNLPFRSSKMIQKGCKRTFFSLPFVTSDVITLSRLNRISPPVTQSSSSLNRKDHNSSPILYPNIPAQNTRLPLVPFYLRAQFNSRSHDLDLQRVVHHHVSVSWRFVWVGWGLISSSCWSEIPKRVSDSKCKKRNETEAAFDLLYNGHSIYRDINSLGFWNRNMHDREAQTKIFEIVMQG